MGVGKSTVGKYLAQFLRYKFIDLDRYIEEKYGKSITEFFHEFGEEAFRLEEYNSLREIVDEYSSGNDKNLILALGGGTVAREESAAIVRDRCCGIYLYCPKEELVRRLRKKRANRPLLQGKNEDELRFYIENLFETREPAYKAASKYIISTESGRLSQVIDDILRTVEFEDNK